MVKINDLIMFQQIYKTYINLKITQNILLIRRNIRDIDLITGTVLG